MIKASRTSVIILALILSSTLSLFSQGLGSKLNLMPIPAKTEILNGHFKLDTSFTISVKGNPNVRIYAAATRMLRHLSGKTGLFFKQDYITDSSKDSNAKMQIFCDHPGKLGINEEESYTLIIDSNKIELNAPTDLGALHGLETLLQLLKADSGGYYFPAVRIQDKPRFRWRGLMIDVARHFMPVNVIERNIDGMAFLKLNVLHLHLSDDQGFRVQSKIYPDLTEEGSDGKYFTQEQIKEIISYADARGIRVVPEFDVPGHTQSWFVSHPELASAPGPYKIRRIWGVSDAVMNPINPATYEFLDKFFGEMSKLFPDEYFHIGGDENNGRQWNANPKIQAFMKAHDFSTTSELQTYFNQKVLGILTKYGKKMIGWDEILQPNMPKNIVIQSWRGHEALFKAAREGYMGILSNGYYLDLYHHASYHYLNDPVPPDSMLSDSVKNNILGGEAAMWGEFVTPEVIDSRIWPRTAAIAERFWSPDSIRNVADMYRRLDIINYELEDFSLTQIKNYDMMLRRLAGNHNISSLKNFVNVVEPVKDYQRDEQGITYKQYSPYTRVVDAARPESETARIFSNYVDEFLNGNDDNSEKIDSLLTLWNNNYINLEKIISVSPILKEIEPMSFNLKAVSKIGLEAIKDIESNKKASLDWINKSLDSIIKAEQPYGQVELEVVKPIERLVEAAGN
jgi:hexosaminidase